MIQIFLTALINPNTIPAVTTALGTALWMVPLTCYYRQSQKQVILINSTTSISRLIISSHQGSVQAHMKIVILYDSHITFNILERTPLGQRILCKFRTYSCMQ